MPFESVVSAPELEKSEQLSVEIRSPPPETIRPPAIVEVATVEDEVNESKKTDPANSAGPWTERVRAGDEEPIPKFPVAASKKRFVAPESVVPSAG
ncbi:MAG: hypothetical protein A3H69_04850 [Candidatus Sungbacteria bacterium RIFCSPLOWO2_02_FULL_47_9]|nr:MAG: hypothetical protein A3H69_04850 [Candidatus Sungbacteria bacterium RIFCSPLOWO2_02_FULL_47_9]